MKDSYSANRFYFIGQWNILNYNFLLGYSVIIHGFKHPIIMALIQQVDLLIKLLNKRLK